MKKILKNICTEELFEVVEQVTDTTYIIKICEDEFLVDTNLGLYQEVTCKDETICSK